MKRLTSGSLAGRAAESKSVCAVAAHFRAGVQKSWHNEDEFQRGARRVPPRDSRGMRARGDFCSRTACLRWSTLSTTTSTRRLEGIDPGPRLSARRRALDAGAVEICVNPLLRSLLSASPGIGKRPNVAKIACMHSNRWQQSTVSPRTGDRSLHSSEPICD